MICLEAVTYWTSIHIFINHLRQIGLFTVQTHYRHVYDCNLNGFAFDMIVKRSDFMCTLYSTNITSQDKSFYSFPISLMCLSYKSNIIILLRATLNISEAAVYERVLNATPCQTHATLRLYVTNKTEKSDNPPKYHTLLYAETYCIIRRTEQINMMKAGPETEWKTSEEQWHTIIQYTASIFFIIQIKHAQHIHKWNIFNLSRRAHILRSEIKDVGLSKEGDCVRKCNFYTMTWERQ